MMTNALPTTGFEPVAANVGTLRADVPRRLDAAKSLGEEYAD